MLAIKENITLYYDMQDLLPKNNIKNMHYSAPFWLESQYLIDYEQASNFMLSYVNEIQNNNKRELIWALEHDNIITKGISSNDSEIVTTTSNNIKIYKANRGGKTTFHGKGQRVYYLMLDLRKRKKDVKLFIQTIKKWIEKCLLEFGLEIIEIDEHVGVWVKSKNGKICKIAAIGVRISKWVTYHGVSINVHPNLSYYDLIIPCGISKDEYGVTSLENEGINISLPEYDEVAKKYFKQFFGSFELNNKIYHEFKT